MTVYMIWHTKRHKYLSVASKHRKYYCRKQNALRAIERSCYDKGLLEVHEYELLPKTLSTGNKLALGSSVKYTEYLTKDKNGTCIYTNMTDNPQDKIITSAYYFDENDDKVNLEPGEGVSKRLYREVCRNGTGIIIDRKNLCVNEVLFFECYDDMFGNECYHITKDLNIFQDCVRVCYSMGKTRWVPVDSIVKE